MCEPRAKRARLATSYGQVLVPEIIQTIAQFIPVHHDFVRFLETLPSFALTKRLAELLSLIQSNDSMPAHFLHIEWPRVTIGRYDAGFLHDISMILPLYPQLHLRLTPASVHAIPQSFLPHIYGASLLPGSPLSMNDSTVLKDTLLACPHLASIEISANAWTNPRGETAPFDQLNQIIQHPKLQSFTFQHRERVRLKLEFADSLVQWLTHHPVHSLVLCNCDLSLDTEPDLALALCDAIQASKTLKKLSLLNEPFFSRHVLHQRHLPSSLTSFEWDKRIQHSEMESDITSNLISAIEGTKQLKRIECAKILSLFAAPSVGPLLLSLTSLSIPSTDEAQEFLELLPRMTSLKSLEITVTNTGAKELMLPESLEKVDLNIASIKDELVPIVLQAFLTLPKLSSLTLTLGRRSMEMLVNIAPIIAICASKLHYLRLAGRRLEREDRDKFFQALAASAPAALALKVPPRQRTSEDDESTLRALGLLDRPATRLCLLAI